MGFIIGCVIYVLVCEGICKMLNLDEFNKKAWVYAIVGVFGSFIGATDKPCGEMVYGY
jgi:CDP-diglyceride synthetase